MPRILLTVSLFLLILTSCTKDETTPPGGNPDPMACDTNNITFSSDVGPILSGSCAISGCHNGATMQSGLDLSIYASVKVIADDGRLIGTITHAAGFPSMPRNASKLAQCTIDKIQAWIIAGAQDN